MSTLTVVKAEEGKPSTENILKRFNVIFPTRVKALSPTFVPGVSHTASDIEDSSNNAVSFTLNIGKRQGNRRFW